MVIFSCTAYHNTANHRCTAHHIRQPNHFAFSQISYISIPFKRFVHWKVSFRFLLNLKLCTHPVLPSWLYSKSKKRARRNGRGQKYGETFICFDLGRKAAADKTVVVDVVIG